MRVCYLPIFFAVAGTSILGISAQHVRVARQLDMSSITDIVSIMTMIMSMMIPEEVMSMFTDSFGPIFSEVPFDFSALSSLSDLTALGRRRRSVYPWDSQIKQVMDKMDKVEKMLQGPIPNVPKDPVVSFDRELPEIGNQDGPYMIPVPYPFQDDLRRRFVRSSQSSKSHSSSKQEEGGGDMQGKGVETAMKGATIAEKGFESGKMASNAGSDVAKSGKSGAEGAAAGADMVSSGAEVLSAGAGQGQDMAGNFSG